MCYLQNELSLKYQNDRFTFFFETQIKAAVRGLNSVGIQVIEIFLEI